MGAMMGRSQQAGRYFQLSGVFVSQIEPLTPDQVEATPATDQIVADFIRDWVMSLRDSGLPTAASPTLTRARRKRIPCAFLMRTVGAFHQLSRKWLAYSLRAN